MARKQSGRVVQKWCSIAMLVVAVLCSGTAAEAGCTIVVTPVTFLPYNTQLNTAITINGSVTVACVVASTFVVDMATGSAGSFTPRKMTLTTLPAYTLAYNLYLDSAYANIWGDNTGGSSHLVVSTPTLAYLATVYAKMPALQNVAAGTYGDSVLTTITF